MPKHTLILILLFIIGCTNDSANQLLIIDETTSHPIEGAWIYLVDEQLVLRSDILGIVTIPVSYNVDAIEITAKNYKSSTVEIANLINNKIKLEIDSTRINPVEADFNFNKADTLIGSYGKYRANNDLLFYDLDVKIDIANKFIEGSNKIQFKMLENDDRVQIDLHNNLDIDSILYNDFSLNFSRNFNSIFIDFSEMLTKNNIYKIEIYYSGYPQEIGRFGGIVFDKDSLGNPWVYTACQGPGANVWWPNKDQQYDEPDSMMISVTVPSNLQDISNGHLISKQELDNNWTKYNWKISYPINNYCVALNIGKYVHFSDTSMDFPINYYVQPHNLEAAKEQFKQVVPMLECFEKHFGDYPFQRMVTS